MKTFSVSCLCILAFCSLVYSYRLQGTVLDESGNPVAGAKVLLLSKNKSAVTEAMGKFEIQEEETALQVHKIGAPSWSLQGGILCVFMSTPLPFQVKVLDLMGNEMLSENRRGVGAHRLDFQNRLSRGKYVARIQAGNYREVFFFSAGENRSGKISGNSESNEMRYLKKEIAFVDSLQVSAESYETLTIALPNLDTNLTLKLHKKELSYAFGWAKGNTPVPTRGCGKTWNRVKSGSYDFFWSKGKRTIRIDIPDNYDNNKPYRLVFGMHCMGGWAGGVQQEGYYGLKPLDTEKTTIFVAPEGNGNQAPWAQDDYTLFDELLADLEGNLCIDSSRVFSAGFSYGSMFTNGLSWNHQKWLRGVAVYETAERNIWLPQHTGEPIAWMGVLGFDDGLCTPEMGRHARDIILEHNSENGSALQESAEEAVRGSGIHLCYDYKTVDSRFPVRWCTQDGGHIWNHKDRGANESWVPQTTWDFITQF